MKQKEKPILSDNSTWRSRLREAMRGIQVANPYESDRHKEAKDYIARRKLKVRALRSAK